MVKTSLHNSTSLIQAYRKTLEKTSLISTCILFLILTHGKLMHACPNSTFYKKIHHKFHINHFKVKQFNKENHFKETIKGNKSTLSTHL